jgi:hypothetical protein
MVGMENGSKNTKKLGRMRWNGGCYTSYMRPRGARNAVESISVDKNIILNRKRTYVDRPVDVNYAFRNTSKTDPIASDSEALYSGKTEGTARVS